MASFKWLVVARNEYRIRTSRIRRVRPYLPYLVGVLLAVYLMFIAPRIVGLIIGDFADFLISAAAIGTVQIILFLLFIYFLMIPITDTLRQEETGQLEIFLAAPIHPSDLLLGEFLGEAPFYVIIVTVVTGFFTAVLSQFGLNVIQVAVTVLIFVITFLSAFWIGTVIAAVLRTKLVSTARGRDIGRALAMIIALPLVAFIYAIQFGGLLQVLANPDASGPIAMLLNLLPSSWGAEVIISFITSPGNLSAVGFETITRLSGLIAFFLAVLWGGVKVANRAYSLEPAVFTASTAKADGIFYRTIHHLGGGKSFGALLVSAFKDYGRRLENLSNVTYIVGLLILMNIFIVPNVPSDPDGPPIALMIAQFLFPVLVVMVAGGVTVKGKETLFIYRKAPFGVNNLVKAKLVHSWLVVIPIAGGITAITTIFTSQSFLVLVGTVSLMMLTVAANTAFTLGLFLLNPPYSVKSVRLWVNLMVVMFVQIGLFVCSLLLLTVGSLQLAGNVLSVFVLFTLLSWIVGLLLLYLGKKKLSVME